MKTIVSLVLLTLAAVFSTRADVVMPAIFSDRMVLQRDVGAVPVWGKADLDEEVTVTIAGEVRKAKPGTDGKWMVKFANLKAGGPHQMVITGKNTNVINNVLIGEVWLGSGQSNMAMTVNKAKDFETEKEKAKWAQIRMFVVQSGPSLTPQDDCKGAWMICTPETVGSFSAALYFFGREIHLALGGVPVGLINSSVGGTPIESWIDEHRQRMTPELAGFFSGSLQTATPATKAAQEKKYLREVAKWKKDAAKAKAEGTKSPRAPQEPAAVRERKGNIGGLFNGKIWPLIPYAIRGALWYQGEANTVGGKAPFYRTQLQLLVQDWRVRWGYDFPFAWVQLPNFTRAGDGWPLVREAMLQSLALPHTGMAITIDIGDPKNIHPENKQEVGRRLALWALGTVYGQKVPAISGPLALPPEINGNEIKIKFAQANDGLVAKGETLKGFLIAGEDKVWKPAAARIDGVAVIVSHPDIAKPAAVRYGWQDNPECNLYNGAGLPASPFRTDDWKQ